MEDLLLHMQTVLSFMIDIFPIWQENGHLSSKNLCKNTLLKSSRLWSQFDS